MAQLKKRNQLQDHEMIKRRENKRMENEEENIQEICEEKMDEEQVNNCWNGST